MMIFVYCVVGFLHHLWSVIVMLMYNFFFVYSNCRFGPRGFSCSIFGISFDYILAMYIMEKLVFFLLNKIILLLFISKYSSVGTQASNSISLHVHRRRIQKFSLTISSQTSYFIHFEIFSHLSTTFHGDLALAPKASE